MIRRKVVKIKWEKTFGELLEKVGKEYSEESVTKVAVCENEQFMDTVHNVPLELQCNIGALSTSLLLVCKR